MAKRTRTRSTSCSSSSHESRSSLPGAGFGGEAAAHLVLGDRSRQHELQQVVRAAGLRADAAQLEPAEGLAVHQRTRALAVDVQVADAEPALHLLQVARAAAVAT